MNLLAGAEDIERAIVELMDNDPALTALALGRAGGQPSDLGIDDLKVIASDAAFQLLIQPSRDIRPAWEQALLCAHYCRAIASTVGYPDVRETYLAGLLHNLDRIAGADSDTSPTDAFSREALADWIEGWNGLSFIADAVRFQEEPIERLRDASPIMLILGLGKLLAAGQPDAPRTAAALMPQLAGVDFAAIGEEVRQKMRQLGEADAVASNAAPVDAADNAGDRVASALRRFALSESAMAGLARCRSSEEIVALASRQLSQLLGLSNPVFLYHDKAKHALTTISATPAPYVVVDIDSSTSVAAKAYAGHRPILQAISDPNAGSLMDYQLARLAERDGIVAIPLHAQTLSGVFLACLPWHGQASFAAEIGWLERWARLVGRWLDRAGQPHFQKTEPAPPLAEDKARKIAHEINNPLGIIKNYLAILSGQTGGEAATVTEGLRIIRDEIDRIGTIVRGLTHENPASAADQEACDLNALIRDLVHVAEPAFRADKAIQVATHLDPKLPTFRCDRDKVKQLLLNLVLNAAEAMEASGNLTLETHLLVNQRQEKLLEVLVSDNGPGIPPELLDRLFEPVPSTKGDGHAGIGLSLVRALATELGMTVSCRTGDTGSTFQLILPLETERERGMTGAIHKEGDTP
ncbi:MAG: HDOD domain-containing protein [Hydrogenophilaceae bacterium]|nr:HDOD domain-containing protein [Hydrogenophilaceae bacterium]